MDRLSSIMVRISLVWLLTGFVVGSAMLADRAVPGQWQAWLAPSHAHMLFVGWFFQFVIGVAYWLLPRRRSAARPLGYQEHAAMSAVVALNLGLVLRITAEPVERMGGASEMTLSALSASALLQVIAALVFVAQLWPRAAARPVRQAREQTV
jgi:hypothetical protein